MTIRLLYGDSRFVLPHVPDASIDSVVTDPPYGLGFMGKEWDSGKSFVERKAAKANVFDHVGGNHNPANSQDQARTFLRENRVFQAWCEEWATECYRVMKPGAYLVAFGGSRTWHRMACAIEDAGFELRDSIAWLYGSGFPKSHNVSAAIDKTLGATREVVGYDASKARPNKENYAKRTDRQPTAGAVEGWKDNGATITAPGSPEAASWGGWGTALKPAFEPIVVARKPLAGTVASNVLTHGVGALNIDGCRIEHASDADLAESVGKNQHADFGTEPGQNQVYGDYSTTPVKNYDGTAGRWPANVIIDGLMAAELDVQSGSLAAGNHPATRSGRDDDKVYGSGWSAGTTGERRSTEVGGASRFFLTVDPSEDDLELTARFYYTAKAPGSERVKLDGEGHPTVKPLALIRWVARLITPPGGHVLDPFAGSGTTGEACLLEGFDCTLVEKHHPYLPFIRQRINRQLDPVAAIKAANADDAGLFDLL